MIEIPWTPILSVVGLAINGYVAIKLAKINKQQVVDAVRAVEVKEVLVTSTEETASTLAKINETTQKTEKLVNNNMDIQKELQVKTSKLLANKTGLAEDVEAWEKAVADLKTHRGNQAEADKVPPPKKKEI